LHLHYQAFFAAGGLISALRKLHVGDVRAGIGHNLLANCNSAVARSSRPEENQLALAEFLVVTGGSGFPSEAAIVFGDIRAHLQHAGIPIETTIS